MDHAAPSGPSPEAPRQRRRTRQRKDWAPGQTPTGAPAGAGDNAGVNGAQAMPLYHQVYLVMREKIRTGAYGDRALPSEHQLCDIFGVSLITVKRAMRTLANDGFVTRHRGRGTFAVACTVSAPRRNTLDDLLQSVREIGETTDMRRIGQGLTRANIEVAEQLKCKPGAPVYRIDQVRMSGAEPIALINAYVPAWVAVRMLDKTTSTQPVLAQVSRAGIAVDCAEQAIGATLADPTAARHLDVEVGLPLIRLTRRVLDAEMQPVEWLVAHYRGDRYEYRTTLSRDGLAGASSAPISGARPIAKPAQTRKRRHA